MYTFFQPNFSKSSLIPTVSQNPTKTILRKSLSHHTSCSYEQAYLNNLEEACQESHLTTSNYFIRDADSVKPDVFI